MPKVISAKVFLDDTQNEDIAVSLSRYRTGPSQRFRYRDWSSASATVRVLNLQQWFIACRRDITWYVGQPAQRTAGRYVPDTV
ncbi:hypothetical protein KCP77_02575 [Salmonella enterica subsp. enterica]|nr:hypothetical protein KCP77_02575 [Salmonella enterica subsp. enterica]